MPRLRRHAADKARMAVEAAEPLVTIVRDDYLRASQVQRWIRQHPNPHRYRLTRQERTRLVREPELAQAYEPVADLFEDPQAWAAQQNEQYLEAQASALDTWFAARFPYALTEQQR